MAPAYPSTTRASSPVLAGDRNFFYGSLNSWGWGRHWTGNAPRRSSTLGINTVSCVWNSEAGDWWNAVGVRKRVLQTRMCASPFKHQPNSEVYWITSSLWTVSLECLILRNEQTAANCQPCEESLIWEKNTETRKLTHNQTKWFLVQPWNKNR